MRRNVNPIRLLTELLLTVFTAEIAVMILLPIIAPGADGTPAALLDGALLSILIAPVLLWRTKAWIWRSSALPTEAVKVHSRTASVATLGVIFVGTFVLILAYSAAHAQTRGRDVARFDQLSERLVTEATRRMNLPVYGLMGARGVYAASQSVERDEFRRYVASRDLAREFPGVLGFGFVRRVPHAELPAFTEAERADGAPNFTPKGFPGFEGEFERTTEHYIVKHCFPDDRNLMAWGTDIGCEPLRREAIERAIDSGHAAATAALTFLGSTRQIGILYFVPVYRNEAPTATLEQRRAAFVGAAYAPIVIEDTIAGLTKSVSGEIDFAIVDSQTGAVGAQSSPRYETGWLNASGFEQQFGRFCSRTSVNIGGHQWQMFTMVQPRFFERADVYFPATILVCGMAFTILAAGFTFSILTSRARVFDLAQAMTHDLARAKAQAERLADIARRTSNAVVITDPLGNIEWVNEGFTRITGYRADEVRGSNANELLRGPETDPVVIARLNEAQRAGQPISAELVRYTKSGRRYFLSIEMVPLRDGAGRITGFMAIETDITERVEQQTALREHADALAVAKAAAEAATEAKSRFLAAMSHEIRTPLNGVIGFADLMRRKADGGDERQRAEWVDIIYSSSTHLLALLNDVLDLSKMDANKMEITVAPCSPRRVISEAAKILASRAVEKGIALEIEFDEQVPLAIRTDATRLRQVILNVVGNAVKFTKSGGVMVSAWSIPAVPPAIAAVTGAKAAPAMLRIAIKDTGIGMTPEQVGKLFTPFQQADRTISRDFGGTGLGLAISRQIARRLGGDITVTSVPGSGSTFLIEITAEPLLPGESVPSDQPTAADLQFSAGGLPLAGRHVLVADDVEANCKVCSIYLKRAGASVTTVGDGKEAVARCAVERFDLVLMDVQMPAMNGMDATRAIRAAGGTMPILALTAFSSGGDRSECLECGMNDLLSKPLDPALLIEVIAKWIQSSTSVRASAVEADPHASDSLAGESADPEIAQISLAWLRDLQGELDLVQKDLDAGAFRSARELAHSIIGSGGTLQVPEFSTFGESLQTAARASDADECRRLIAAMRQQIPRTATRMQHVVNLPRRTTPASDQMDARSAALPITE